MVSKHSTSLQSCPCSYPQLISFHTKNWPFVPTLCSLSLLQFLIHDRTLPFTPGLPSFSIASCAWLYQKPFEGLESSLLCSFVNSFKGFKLKIKSTRGGRLSLMASLLVGTSVIIFVFSWPNGFQLQEWSVVYINPLFLGVIWLFAASPQFGREWGRPLKFVF